MILTRIGVLRSRLVHIAIAAFAIAAPVQASLAPIVKVTFPKNGMNIQDGASFCVIGSIPFDRTRVNADWKVTYPNVLVQFYFQEGPSAVPYLLQATTTGVTFPDDFPFEGAFGTSLSAHRQGDWVNGDWVQVIGLTPGNDLGISSPPISIQVTAP